MVRENHPDWGKKRIADELAKANNWVPLVSSNTVKRILKDAGLWEAVEAEVGKKAGKDDRSNRRRARADRQR